MAIPQSRSRVRAALGLMAALLLLGCTRGASAPTTPTTPPTPAAGEATGSDADDAPGPGTTGATQSEGSDARPEEAASATGEAAPAAGSGTPGSDAAGSNPSSEKVTFQLGINMVPTTLPNNLAEAIEARYPEVEVKIQPRRSGPKAWPEWIETNDLVLLPFISIPTPDEVPMRDLSAVQLPELDPLVVPLFEEVSRVEGRRYVLPFVLQPQVLYMNPERLAADGVAEPPLDWNLAEFEATVTGLTDQGHPPFPLVSLARNFVSPLVRSFGGRLQDPETGEWALETPESRQALSWLARMVQGGRLTPDRPQEVYLNTEKGVAFSYPFDGWGPLPKGNVYQPFPAGPRGRFAPLAGHVGVVPASSRNPELAVEILTSLIADPEFRLILARAGARPLVPDPAAMAAWREALGERNAQAVELGFEGAYVGEHFYQTFRAIEALAPYLRGEVALEEALQQLPDPQAEVGE